MVAFTCVYALVALVFMAYSRLSGGPWVDAVDFVLDVLVCALWPLGLCILVFDCLARRKAAPREESVMDLGVTETDQCPFAANPDMTGCDCDCKIPHGRGFWAALRWWFGPTWCTSGRGGCGNGMLPCQRFEKWRKSNGKI